MKDYSKFNGKEIRIRRYGYGKVVKIKDDTFTFKIPVDDMKWEKLELSTKYLKHAKEVKNSELDRKRFRISFIVKNFYSKILSWEGRTSRKEYFFGRFFSHFILVIPSLILAYYIMINEPKKLFVYLACALIIFRVITFAGTISLTARRLQDIGYKGVYSLAFYSIILSLLSYGLWTLEDPLLFLFVIMVIYVIFELLMIFTMSDFDNKYGPCPIARIDDDEHIDGKKIIQKEGEFTNLKEFTEKVKSDNKLKDEEKNK